VKPSPQFRSCLSLLLLLPALTGSGVWAQPAGPKQPGAHPVPLTVRLRLGGKSVLAAKDIAFSTFPGGRRCAYTYTGVRNPRTIQYLQKLGFRTTLYVGAKTPAERVKALEDAGAEIGMAQGFGYGSPHRAVQVNYDIAAADRLALKKKCIGPVICSTVNIGNYPSSRALYYFAAARSPDYARGYGAAYHDSNFRFLYHPSPVVKYLLYLGRGPGEPRTMVAKHDSAGKSGRKAPNERLFYRLLANQFRVALRLVEAGKFVKFRIRDFKQADLEEMGRIIGKYGKHHLIWHATEGEVGAYSYLKAKSRVAEVKRIGAGEVEVTVALAGDVFPPHLLAPLSLKLPSGVEVTSAGIGRISCEVVEQSDGPHVVVPVGRALRDGCEMALETSAPDMTVPDRMPVTLTVRNTSGEPLADGRLEWVGDAGISGAEGMTVTGGTDTPFTLPPAGEHKIKAVVRTLSGARFGLTPILAKVTATVGGRRRVFLEGFEIVVAPLVALRQDPYNRFPLAKGRRQDFLVHVDNRSRFLAHKAGPCKGVVTFKLPAGMAAVPAEQPFELKQNDVRTLTFTIRNNQWGKDPVWVRPVVRLGGAKTIFETPYPGTWVYRDEKHLAASGVNGQGLRERIGHRVRLLQEHRSPPGHRPLLGPQGAQKGQRERLRPPAGGYLESGRHRDGRQPGRGPLRVLRQAAEDRQLPERDCPAPVSAVEGQGRVPGGAVPVHGRADLPRAGAVRVGGAVAARGGAVGRPRPPAGGLPGRKARQRQAALQRQARGRRRARRHRMAGIALE